MNMMDTQIGQDYGRTASVATVLPGLEAEGLLDRTDVFIKRVTNRTSAVAELKRVVELLNAGVTA